MQKTGHGPVFCATPATEPLELTFIVTRDPLQRCDVVVVLANGEGEDADLFGEERGNLNVIF